MSIDKVKRYEAEVLTHPSGYPARVAMAAYDTGRYIEYADVAGLVAALSVLATACHEEFGVDDRNEDGDYIFEDDDTVADPDCPITFGMIRRARNELARWTK